MKLNRDITKGVVFLVVAITLMLLMPSQIKLTDDSAINARTFPTLLLQGVIVCSLCLIVTGLLSKKKAYFVINKQTVKEILPSIGMIIIFGIYVAMIINIGFLVASLVCCCGTLAYLRCKKPLYYVLVAGFCVFVYLLFTQLLNVYLP